MTGSRRGGDLRVRSCLNLRKSIGVIGSGLPPTPAVGGLLLMATSLQTWVRDGYRTGMREVVVGGRFAIAVFMGSHPGHVASRSPV